LKLEFFAPEAVLLNIRHLELLGEALTQLRVDATDVSQAVVCERAGLRAPQVSRWENGREVPTLESLIKYLGAIGAGLADLERMLRDVDETKRRTAIGQEVKRIRADHQRRIASRAGLRQAVEEMMRAGPGRGDGLDFLRGRSDGAGSRQLEGLIAGLPETLEVLLDDPERHRPAAVEGLIAKARAMLAERDWRAREVADAARRLAAELPEGVARERRLTLRARSLELWGTLERVAGEPAAAEAALLSAFELLARIEDVEAPDLAVILGRCALAASDRRRADDLARYAAEAVRLARAADRDWPLPALRHLWQTVMADPKRLASGVRLAEALFAAAREAYGGFEDQPWTMSLEIVDLGDAGVEIRLERSGSRAGLPGWTTADPLVCRCGRPGRLGLSDAPE
jgi:transcriptional regulator with XRE-family HTH domain